MVGSCLFIKVKASSIFVHIKSNLDNSYEHYHDEFYNYCWGNIVHCTMANLSLILIVLSGLVFSEYLLSGQAPPIKEVNDEEPLFPALPFLNVKSSYKVSNFCTSFMWLAILLTWENKSVELEKFYLTFG